MIGINQQIKTRSGGGEGVGFAVPIDLAKRSLQQLVELDDPWGWGRSLEWATSCPPPLRNFDKMPRIRSERPAFDLHYPETVGRAEFHASPEMR